VEFPVDLNLICRKSKLWILKLVGKFNADFLRKHSCRLKNWQLLVIHERISCKFKSTGKSARNGFYFAKSVVKFWCNKINPSSEANFPIFQDLSQYYYLFLMILWHLRLSSSLSFSLFFPPQFTLYWKFWLPLFGPFSLYELN